MMTISHTRGLTTWPGWMATALLVSASLLVVSGCGSQGPPKPVNFGADIIVTEDLNPDTNGRPSPLMLAVYQLKSADKFQNTADFFSVFDPKGAALSDDLIRREQITLQPGGNRAFETEVDAQTAYIGVVGAFSDLENAQWRSVVEIPEKDLLKRINIFKNERLRISVGERSVDISFDEK